MGTVTEARAAAILAENFAPWIQDLGLRIDHMGDQSARLRLPMNDRLSREGGTVCGQAMMALADTAMVFAISAALGDYAPMTTVSQNLSFMRPVTDADVIAEARVLKLGRNLVFGEVTLSADGGGEPVAHATTTYALLPPPRPS